MSIEAPETPTEELLNDERDLPPIAVSLADRAAALDAIMSYLNKANMTKGSQIQLENGGGEFGQRYGEAAPEVQKGAEKNTAELLPGFRDGIDILAATTVMEANGHGEDAVEKERMKMQIAINRQFGVGRARAAERNAVADQARSSYMSSSKVD